MEGFLRFLISERTVVGVILLNAVVMTANGFYDEGDAEHLWLGYIDYACVVFFVVEAILKIRFLGVREYFSSNWNRFDLVVTLLCLPVLWEPFIAGPNRLGWAPIFRTGRLFRLFRLLRFIPNVDHLLIGIRRALRASIGVFLALFLVNLILALTATYFFEDVAPDKFGDPAQSFYSIFRIFTVEGWYEYPDDLEATQPGATKNTSGWLVGIRIFFMASVLVGGMLGMSLANAVFLDEMTMDNTQTLERKVDELAERLRTLQDQLDRVLERRS